MLKKLQNNIEFFQKNGYVIIEDIYTPEECDLIINSAHDISDGGLATTIAESFVYSKNNLGVKLNLNRKSRNDELLFGECQSSIVVSIPEDKLLDLINIAKEFDVPTQTIGKVTKENIIEINDLISLSKEEVKDAYFNSFETIMKQ